MARFREGPASGKTGAKRKRPSLDARFREDGIGTDARFREGIGTDARFREDLGTDARFREGIGTEARFREGIGTDARFREDLGTDARFREDGIGLDARFREGVMDQFYVNTLMTNNPSADGAFALGKDAEVVHTGALGFGGGMLTGIGDAQAISMILRTTTSGIVAKVLKLSDNTLPVLPQYSVWAFSILLVSRRTDNNGEGAANCYMGAIRRDEAVGTTALIGAVATIMSVSDVGIGAVVVADAVNGALELSVLGQVGKTINYVARLEITQTRTV